MGGLITEPQKQVAATRKALLKTLPSERANAGGPGKFRLLVSPLGAGRAAPILDALVAAAAQRGWTVTDTEKGLAIKADRETVGFMIEEKLTAEPHTPTPAELRAQAAYIRDCALADGGNGFRPWREPTIPSHDHVPNGDLVLRLDDNYAYRPQRRTFSDGKRQRLELMIELIADAFEKCAAAMKTRRAEDERRKLEWEEADRRRRQQENQARVEGYRINFLRAQIDRLREVEDLGNLISHWEKSALQDKAFTGLLDFARQYREWLARKLDANAVAARVSELKLMSDDVYIYDATRID